MISELPGWADPAARNTRDQRAAKESAEQFLTLFCVISELPGWVDPAAPLSADWERPRGHRATGERQR